MSGKSDEFFLKFRYFISSKIFSDKNCRQSKLFLMKNFTCLVYFSKWNENWKADNLLEMTFQQFKWSRISEY